MLGRDELIEQLCATLLREPAPAVALLGPGGIGKSTLTLAALHRPEVVARFGARRWFVRLDTASTADAAVGLLSAALGLPPSAQPLPAVQAFLAQAPGVLALDNLETPWEAAGEREGTEALLHTLTAIPGLALIASVRGQQRPHGLGAQPLTVPPLRAPDASALFCELSQASPDDPALGPLLAQLEGVPLAITLLAHVAEGASVAGLAAEWQQKRTELLRREGAKPGRETSWAASMALSVGSPRMTDEARRLLALLGRLPDGVAFEDLATLLPGTWHEAQRRLVQVGLAYNEGERVRVLAPVREYARATLTPTPDDVKAARGLYGQLATTLGPKAGREGGAEAIARLAPETANLEAMLREGLASAEPAPWIDASVELANFAHFSGHSSPSPLEAALEAARRVEDPGRQARCLESLGDIALARSAHDEAHRLYDEALPLHRKAGDVKGEAGCIQGLGHLALRRSDHAEARRRFEEALSLFGGNDVKGKANCILKLGDVALRCSAPDEAKRHYKDALSLFRQAGDVQGEACCIGGLGHLALRRSEHDEARRRFGKALSLFREVGDVKGEANSIQGFGKLELQCANHAEARRRFEKALSLFRQVGDVLGEADCVRGLAKVASGCSNFTTATEHYQTALSLYTRLQEPRAMGLAHRRLARLAADAAEKQRHVAAARELWAKIDLPDLVAELDAEFVHAPPAVGTGRGDTSAGLSGGAPKAEGEVRAEQRPTLISPGEPAPAATANRQTSVFVSWSHSETDKVYLTELETQLAPFERSSVVNVWHRGRAPAGTVVAREVADRLDEANVVLLLVSPDFMASNDCMGDASLALKRCEGDGGRGVAVVPILVRPTAGLVEHPVGVRQPLPRGGKAISQWTTRDDAWVDVIEGLRALLKKQRPGER